ncbi:MAG: Heme A synthase [Owenweeksia sp. TMED14]|nr:MAG: Heme A synthase [Owenweeksia sp. TMED14]
MLQPPSTLWTSILRRLLQLSIVFTFLVIIAGSIVRMTGSGMGCPDWPKCFGLIIPPVNVSQVLWVPNTFFNEGQMILKDEKLLVASRSFNTHLEIDYSNWIQYDRHDYIIFNPVHTWIEYINRLLGALLGIPILLASIFIFYRIRSHPKWSLTIFAALITLLFEAWLGKIVVDGNLIPHQITFHLAGAFVLLGLLALLYRSVSSEWEIHAFVAERDIKGLVEIRTTVLYIFILLSFFLSIQIILGTQVREEVDVLMKNFGVTGSRLGWVSKLSQMILVHRSFSLVILILSFYLLKKSKGLGGLRFRAGVILIIFIFEAFLGASMYYLDIPRIIQPIHIILSAMAWFLIIDGLFKSWLMVRDFKS